MLKNRSFLSWWSYGKIRFHVVAFARNSEAEKVIIDDMIGSDHPRRRYPKSQKIKFYSHCIYRRADLRQRWGTEFARILNLCKSVTAVRKRWRLGFRETMSNIIFFHSVPNNIPGVLWSKTEKWQPLFPGRVLPLWVSDLLESRPSIAIEKKIPKSLMSLLQHIKRGVRTKSGLSRELGYDIAVIDQLIFRREILVS